MSTNALYNRIKELCDQKGVKGGKLCTDLDISKSLLTDLKMGRRSGVNAATAQKIASYFGISVGYLLGEEEEIVSEMSYLQAVNKLTELVQQKDFIELYESYQKLNDKNKQIVKRLIEDLMS